MRAGVRSLVFIHAKIDKWCYLNILKNNLRKRSEKMGILNNFKFYANNDLKHTSHVAKSWLLYNCVKVIRTPPQLPDVNVIEHLWYELEKIFDCVTFLISKILRSHYKKNEIVLRQSFAKI